MSPIRRLLKPLFDALARLAPAARRKRKRQAKQDHARDAMGTMVNPRLPKRDLHRLK